MSYDVGVFFTQRPHSDEAAGERYSAYCSDEDFSRLIEPSPRVAAFLHEVTGLYPEIHDVPDEALDDCPWSASFDVSDGHALMPMTYPQADVMVSFLVDLADKHGLVCFDPQTGKILSAPPGIHVDESEPTLAEVAFDQGRRDALFVGLLDEMLGSRGFQRRRRFWSKNGESAIIALRTSESEGIYDISFCIWFKALGEIDPRKVKPEGEFHIYEELDGEFLPERLQFRLLRAFHFDGDYAESITELYGTGEDAMQIVSYYEPYEPLTPAWRLATLREAMELYVLPFFDRVETVDHEVILGERAAREEEEHQENLAQAMSELRSAVARIHRLHEDGADDKVLIAAAMDDLNMVSWAAVGLCAATGWTIDEAKDKLMSKGLGWSGFTDELIDATVEDFSDLVRHPDGRIELISP